MVKLLMYLRNESHMTCIITKNKHLIMILLHYVPPIKLRASRKITSVIQDSFKRPDENIDKIFSTIFSKNSGKSGFKCL